MNLKPGYKVVDATIGGGGHAIEILERIQPGGILIGLDADASAVKISQESLKRFGPSCRVFHSNFRYLDKVLSDQQIGPVNAVLFDVGLSSLQLDDGRRGFSIMREGPLDMRFDITGSPSASDIINRLNEDALDGILKDYGEEIFHRKIARAIVEARKRKHIDTTAELKDIIHRITGFRRSGCRIDPATRTFQAVRIAVNDELGALNEGLNKGISALIYGGRLSVISFHSLEDRIAKNICRESARKGIVRIITKKPLRPSSDEIASNPRSRSARLRTAEKI